MRTAPWPESGSSSLILVPAGNLYRIQHKQHIQNSGGGNQTRAVISGRARNVGAGLFDCVREQIKNAGACVGDKSQQTKCVITARRENISAHPQTDDRQYANGGNSRDGPSNAAMAMNRLRAEELKSSRSFNATSGARNCCGGASCSGDPATGSGIGSATGSEIGSGIFSEILSGISYQAIWPKIKSLDWPVKDCSLRAFLITREAVEFHSVPRRLCPPLFRQRTHPLPYVRQIPT